MRFTVSSGADEFRTSSLQIRSYSAILSSQFVSRDFSHDLPPKT